MNLIFLTGHVGQEPQSKTFDNKRKVLIFSLATNKRYKDTNGEMKETATQWHNVQAWGYLADVAVQKGNKVHVVGEVQYREYTDKDGIKRSITDVVATELNIIKTITKVAAAPMPDINDDPFAKKEHISNNAPLPTEPIGETEGVPF